MKTQHIATDLLTLPKEQAPEIERSAEQFQAAMKSVTKQSEETTKETVIEEELHTGDETTKETVIEEELHTGDETTGESNLEVEMTESETSNELKEKETEDEPVLWFNMGNIRLTENLEKQIPVLKAGIIEVSGEFLNEESGFIVSDTNNVGQLADHTVEMTEKEAVELLESLPIIESGESILPEELKQAAKINLKDTVQPVETEIVQNNGEDMEKVNPLLQTTEPALINASDEVQEVPLNIKNLTQVVDLTDTQPVEQLQEAGLTNQEVVIPNPSVVNKNTESIELNSEIQEDLIPFEIQMGTEVVSPLDKPQEVDEQDLPVKTETVHKQPTEITQLGQLNQMRILPSTQQTEPFKVVPQEQWVQEVETFIVDAVEGTKPTEKITTTRIQLTPKHLGEMDIELVLKDKGLTARLVVEEIETKQWLEQKLTQLTNQLATQEIKVEEFHIIVASSEQNGLDASFDGQSAFKQREKSSKQNPSFHQGLEEEPAQVSSKQMNRSTAGRISMWV